MESHESQLEILEDIAYPSDLHIKIMSQIPGEAKSRINLVVYIGQILKVLGITLGLVFLGTAGARMAGVKDSNLPKQHVKDSTQEKTKDDKDTNPAPTDPKKDDGQVRGVTDVTRKDEVEPRPGKTVQDNFQESKAVIQEMFKNDMKSAETVEEKKEAVTTRFEENKAVIEERNSSLPANEPISPNVTPDTLGVKSRGKDQVSNTSSRLE